MSASGGWCLVAKLIMAFCAYSASVSTPGSLAGRSYVMPAYPFQEGFSASIDPATGDFALTNAFIEGGAYGPETVVGHASPWQASAVSALLQQQERGVSGDWTVSATQQRVPQHELLAARQSFVGATHLALERAGLRLMPKDELIHRGVVPGTDYARTDQIEVNESDGALFASGIMALGALKSAEEPTKKVVTASGRLSTLALGRLFNIMFPRIRALAKTKKGEREAIDPFYSIAILMPMTTWNSVGNSLGTTLKMLIYLAAREYFRIQEEDPKKFLDSLTIDDLLRTYEEALGQTTLDLKDFGKTTVVNGVMVGVQSPRIDLLEPFLESLEEICTGLLGMLFDSRQAILARDVDNMPKPSSGGLQEVDALIGDFVQTSRPKDQLHSPENYLFYRHTDDDGMVRHYSLGELYFEQVYAGASKYNEALDEQTPGPEAEKRLNPSSIFGEGMRVRDSGIKNAELCAEEKGENGRVLIDDPRAKDRSDQVWREGRFLSPLEVLTTLRTVDQDTDFEDPARPRRYDTDKRSPLISSQRRTPQKRVFKGAHFKDLEAVAEIVATNYLAYLAQIKTPSVTGHEDAASMARAWVEGLEGMNQRAPSTVNEEFAHALSRMFLEELDDPRLVAIYHECGGIVEPQKILRMREDAMAEIYDIMDSLYYKNTIAFMGPVALDETERNRALVRLYLDALDRAAYFFSVAEHDLRDGIMRTRDMVAAAALESVVAYYDELEADGIIIPHEERVAIFIGGEAKNAKVYNEIRPVTAKHGVDRNMGSMAFMAPAAGVQIFGESREYAVVMPVRASGAEMFVDITHLFPGLKNLGFLGGGSPLEEYKQGDETVPIMPGHKRDGSLVTHDEINERLRAEGASLYPEQGLHYNHKQPTEQGTLRLKLYTVQTTLDLEGCPAASCSYTIATKQGALNGVPDRRFWVVAIDGAELETPLMGNLDDENLDNEPEKVTGPMSFRFVSIERPLSSLSVEEVDRLVDEAMNLDVRVKKKKDPTDGIWVYNEAEDTLTRVASTRPS